MVTDAVLILLAYLFGSIATAIVVCRLMGLPDPREIGSGNPGATNVLRLCGRLPAALTLVGDFLKGTVPVAVTLALGRGDMAVALAGLAAFLGHLYPLYFGFKGGKGVATGLGVLLAWSWPGMLATVAVWLVVAALFRYASLAAMVSFLLAPLVLLALDTPGAVMAGMAAITVLTYWRHRNNIRNLLDGTENKLGTK